MINVGGKAVRAAGFGDEHLERRELLRLARASNYIPRGADLAYEEALWREYSKQG
jgi:hypothetical protein